MGAMEKYEGKSRCCCGKRAKFQAYHRSGRFSCHDKKCIDRIKEIIPPVSLEDLKDYTEADHETWMKI